MSDFKPAADGGPRSASSTLSSAEASKFLSAAQRTPSSRVLSSLHSRDPSATRSDRTSQRLPGGPEASTHSDSDNSEVSVTSRHTLRTIGDAAAGQSGITLISADEDDDERDADLESGARSARDRTSAAWAGVPSRGLGSAATSPAGAAGAADPTASMTPAQASRWRRQVLLRVALKLSLLFVVCTVALGGTLWLALPVIDDADRPAFKIPKSFDELKALNAVLQRYKDENFTRVMLCWIVVYMFLQAFSIPGSMYMSILAGAMWGVPLALPIVCASVATGATICYLISKFMGQVLVALPKWKARVDAWRHRLDEHRDNMLSYMIVIRMMPLPPHNIVNILAPHLGIDIPLFWISTFFGIFAVSVIHTTIGEKLDQMTSPEDFHLFSVRNALLLGGVICAVMVPVAMRRYSAAARAPLEEAEPRRTGSLRLEGDEAERDARLAMASGKGAAGGLVGRGRFGDDDDDDDDDELPPVRLRGALQAGGVGAGADQTRAWREQRSLVGSRRSGYGDDDDDGVGYEAMSDDAEEVASSVDGEAALFDDRREQPRRGGGGGGSGGRAARGTRTAAPPPRGARAQGVRGKAARILGLGDDGASRGGGGGGGAVSVPAWASAPATTAQEAASTLSGAVGQLWSRVSGGGGSRGS